MLLFPLTLFAQGEGRTSGATLTGFAENPVFDEGKIVRLEIGASVRATTEGTYKLTFELTAADGRGLTGEVRVKLEPGDRNLTVVFTAQELRNFLGQDGPYTVSDGRLFSETSDSLRVNAVLEDSSAIRYQTKAYRIADFYRNPYALTGDFEAVEIDPRPGGGFGALRVRFGITTPGANCSATAMLKDQSSVEIDFENSPSGPALPAGKGYVELVFPGPKILAHGKDGPFRVTNLSVGCRRVPDNRPEHLETRTEFQTPAFHVADFNASPDFELSLFQPSYKVPAGANIPASVWIRMIGLSDEAVDLQFRSSEPGLQFAKPTEKVQGPSGYYQSFPEDFSIQVREDLKPGIYPVEVTGRRNGHQRAVRFTVNVDAEMSRSVREYKQTLADLARPDPPPDPPKSAPASQLAGTETGARFSAGVALRKMRTVLLIDTHGGCDFAKAEAIRFSRLFVDGRDSLGIVSFSHVAQVIAPLSDHFPSDLEDRIKKIPCGMFESVHAAALKLAESQLTQEHVPDAVDAIVLFTFTPPSAIIASWPLNQLTDRGPCPEASNGTVTATAIPRYQVVEIYPRTEAGPVLVPPDFPANATYKDWLQVEEKQYTCFGSTRRPRELITSMPEHDSDGIALSGSYVLERWPAGPHANQIRIDRVANLLNAAQNQVENLAERVRSEGLCLYVVAPDTSHSYASGPSEWKRVYDGWPDSLHRMVNDRQSGSFKSGEPSGLAILIKTPADVWSAFERIRQDILERAAVK